MTRVVMKSKVGADGVLHLDVPLGAAQADREVQVIVESVAEAMDSQEEMRRWVTATAGKWQGDFERPEQGEPEERESSS